VRSLIDRILRRTPPDHDDRVAKDAVLSDLATESERTERRVERLVRLARMDAEIAVHKARTDRK
jgi:hypothetical protein